MKILESHPQNPHNFLVGKLLGIIEKALKHSAALDKSVSSCPAF